MQYDIYINYILKNNKKSSRFMATAKTESQLNSLLKRFKNSPFLKKGELEVLPKFITRLPEPQLIRA